MSSNEKRLQIRFFPDYTQTNPYQKLLYRGFAGHQVQPGTIVDAVRDVEAGLNVVFHIHWPEPLLAGASTEGDLRLRVDTLDHQFEHFTKLGGRIIWTIHNKQPHDVSKRAAVNRLQAVLLKHAHLVHFHSKEAVTACADLLPVQPNRILVYPHGNYEGCYPSYSTPRDVSRAQFGLSSNDFVIGFIGQIRPYKGISKLIEAVTQARKIRPEIKLFISGMPVHPIKKGWLSKVISANPGTVGCEGYIHDDDLASHVEISDAIALPYDDILTSGSAMLATTFGKPLILPDLATLASFRGEAFCRMFQPGNVDDIASAIVEMARADRDEQARMAAAARAFAAAHNWDGFAKEVLDRLDADTGGMPLALPKRSDAIGLAIVNYRSADDTIRLVRELPRTINGRDVAIVIADNSECEIEYRALQSAIGSIATVIDMRGNVGYAEANNAALERLCSAGADVLGILNPDVSLSSNTVEKIVAYLGRTPDTICSPIILRPGGLINFAGGFADRKDPTRFRHHLDGLRLADSTVLQDIECDVVHGCAMFFSSATWRKAGPLPVEYFLYYEETEWCMRAKAKGIRNVVLSDATVTHNKKSHGSGTPGLSYFYYLVRGRVLFALRNGIDPEIPVGSLRDGFIRDWTAKLVSSAPSFVKIFQSVTAAAIADGLANKDGKVNIASRVLANRADAGTVSGFVDDYSRGAVSGWSGFKSAGRDSAENDKLWLMVDGFPVESSVANVARPDVEAAGYKLNSGFSIEIPRKLMDYRAHQLEVYSSKLGLPLRWTPETKSSGSYSSARTLSPPLVTESQPKLIGRIDGISGGVLRGWVKDAANPFRTLDVEVFGDSLPFPISIRADVFRADLLAAGFSTGIHGFEIALPVSVLESATTLHLRCPGDHAIISSREVKQSFPKSVPNQNCSPAEFLAWSFIDGRTPPGWIDHAPQVNEWLARSFSHLTAHAHAFAGDVRASIIMPVFNRDDTLLRSLESVAQQTYHNFELVLIDDGSSDGSLAIARTFAAQNPHLDVKIFEHDINRGVSAARNTGLQASTGEVICYLDSDNEWYPETLGVLVSQLILNRAHAVYAGQEIIEYIPGFDMFDRRSIRVCPFNRSRLERRNFIDLNVFAHSRALYESLGGFRTDLRRLVDWELILRYTADRQPLLIPALLTRYFVGRASNQITSVESFSDNYRKIVATNNDV